MPFNPIMMLRHVSPIISRSMVFKVRESRTDPAWAKGPLSLGTPLKAKEEEKEKKREEKRIGKKKERMEMEMEMEMEGAPLDSKPTSAIA